MNTPPPPYQWPGGYAAPIQSSGFYEQTQYPSQLQLAPKQPRTLHKKRSGWKSKSTRDLTQPQPSQSSSQEQGWVSTTHLNGVPEDRTLDSRTAPQPLVRAAACADNVADRLRDLFSRVDGSGQEVAELEALTRELSLDDSRHAFVSGLGHRSVATQKASERNKASLLNVQKSWMYANSRLPKHMRPYVPYLSTWRLFCRAAEASSSVYKRPSSGERQEYVEADSRQGTKAMALKSIVEDHDKLIVIAIRGSQWNVFDWAVNFNVTPIAPIGFLDDETNACHSGFLQVARSMVQPVAARLQQIVEQDPSRVNSSLLFTGHSAGGAVANLLYLHMLSESIESELTRFDGIFKRTHCVTFGVPPMALLPLQNPAKYNHRKYQFVSFLNEGDPIVRADFEYMVSLARLYTTRAPDVPKQGRTQGLRQKMSRPALRGSDAQAVKTPMPEIWPVPDATLSNAGRLVLLREIPGQRTKVEAVSTSDEQLRGVKNGMPVVFGDLVMHHVDVYERRIQNLAIASVTGKEIG